MLATMTTNPDRSDPFADVWTANARFADGFRSSGMTGVAARDLTVVTCMDTRIDPLAVLGLKAGDAKIIRAAGARVGDDVLHSLVYAVRLLGGHRILLMPHTRCGLGGTDDEIRAGLAGSLGTSVEDPRVRAFEPRGVTDWEAAVDHDIALIRAHDLLGPEVMVAAAVYDVDTGLLSPLRP